MPYSNLIFYCRSNFVEFLYWALNWGVFIGLYFCISVVIFSFDFMKFDIVYETIRPS
jgi:hypothetical protein